MLVNNAANRSLSGAVLAAVAKREGIDPVELSEPLFPAIDTEALDRLFKAASGTVTFQYLDYEIRVDSDGTVEVQPTF